MAIDTLIPQLCYICKKPNTIYETGSWTMTAICIIFINNFLEKNSYLSKQKKPAKYFFLFCNRWSWPPFSMPFQKSKWDSGTRLAPIQYTLHVSISTSVVNMRNVTGPSSSISISLYRRSNKGRIGHLQQQKGQQKCRSSNFLVHFSIFRFYNQILYACTLNWRMEVKKIICFVKYQIRLRNWGVLH